MDLRSHDERARDGVIPGSVHVPRSVLEWRVDPGSGYSNPVVADGDVELILVCHEGYSSSLAAASLRGLGRERVADLVGRLRRLARCRPRDDLRRRRRRTGCPGWEAASGELRPGGIRRIRGRRLGGEGRRRLRHAAGARHREARRAAARRSRGWTRNASPRPGDRPRVRRRTCCRTRSGGCGARPLRSHARVRARARARRRVRPRRRHGHPFRGRVLRRSHCSVPPPPSGRARAGRGRGGARARAGRRSSVHGLGRAESRTLARRARRRDRGRRRLGTG